MSYDDDDDDDDDAVHYYSFLILSFSCLFSIFCIFYIGLSSLKCDAGIRRYSNDALLMQIARNRRLY